MGLHIRGTSPPVRLSVVGAFLLAGSGGCSTAVEVTPPAGAGSPACTTVGTLWPEHVAGHRRVGTSSDSPAVAAWGDPAIIARCGVTSPGPTTNDCISVNAIDWVAEPLDNGTSYVTYGREPAIQVLVPSAHAPAAFALPPFTTAATSIPQGPRRCG